MVDQEKMKHMGDFALIEVIALIFLSVPWQCWFVRFI